MYLSVAALYYVWDGKTFCFGSTLSQRNLCKTCFMIWVLLFQRPCLCTTPSDGIIRKILGSNTQGLNKINMHDWKAYFWLPNLRFFFRKKEKKRFSHGQKNCTSRKEGIWSSSWRKSLAIDVGGWSKVLSPGAAAEEFASSITQWCRQEIQTGMCWLSGQSQAYLFTQVFALGVVWAHWLN